MFSVQLHIYPETKSHSPRPHALPLLKTSAFPVSPNNARTSSSTSWFSGRRGRNLSLVTRCSFLPLHLQLLSIFTLLSLFLSPLSRSRRLSSRRGLAGVLLPHLQRGPTQVHAVERTETSGVDGTQTNTRWRQDVPQDRRIFLHVTDMF